MGNTTAGLSFFVCAFLCSVHVFAQKDSLLVQNSKPVDKSRYDDVNGSPYYFSDWVKGDILRSDGQTVENVPLNYNGHTHEMDVLAGEEVFTLDRRWHLRIDVAEEDNPGLAEEFPAKQLIFAPVMSLSDRSDTTMS
jgi:hypothetical protein